MAASASSISLFPPPPPTHNALTRAQRTQLLRSASKLERVLGSAPHIPEQAHAWSSFESEFVEFGDDNARWEHIMKPAPELASHHPCPPRAASKFPAIGRKRPALFPISTQANQNTRPPPDEAFYLADLLTPPPPHLSSPGRSSSSSSSSESLRSSPSPSSISPFSWVDVEAPNTPYASPKRVRRNKSFEMLRSLGVRVTTTTVTATAAPPGLHTRSSSVPPAPTPVRAEQPMFNTHPARTPPSPLSPGTPKSNVEEEGEEEDGEQLPPPWQVSAPSFRIPSDSAMRRAKMERLRRRLGECVPVALVFPKLQPEVIEEESEMEEDGEEDADDDDLVDISSRGEEHLANTRVPFLWRKRLTVILEHE